MGWNDFYRRRDALDAVLRRDPAGPLEFDRTAFETADELLLALHHRWLQQLTGRLGLALAETDDRVEAVLRTWRALAAEQPALRGALDAHLSDPEAVEREERLLALTSGLADLSEPTAEVTRIGAAFLALIRSEPAVRSSRGRLLSRA
jgi:phage tail protein X